MGVADPQRLGKVTSETSSGTASTGPIASGKGCPICRCYLFDCSLISRPDIDCQDQFASSCNSFDQIVPDFQCKSICDCCYNGECLPWSSPLCFFYIAYGFINSLSLIFLCIFVYCLIDLTNLFFKLDSEDETEDVRLEREINELRNMQHDFVGSEFGKKKKTTKIRVKYSRILMFHLPKEAEEKIDQKYRSVLLQFFDRVDELKPIAMKNLIVLAVLMFGLLGVGMSVILNFFTGNNTVCFFGILALVKNIFFVIMLVIVLVGYLRVPRYFEKLEETMKEFGTEWSCKVEIEPDKGEFRFEMAKKRYAGGESALDSRFDFNSQSLDPGFEAHSQGDDSRVFLKSKNNGSLGGKNNKVVPISGSDD
jgi:hypothetical protein